MSAPTPIETVEGLTRMTVEKTDGSSEAVAVRQLNLRELQAYLANEQDLAACAELFCGKKKGWADQVRMRSVLSVVAEGRRLNSDFLAEYLAFQKDQEGWVKTVAGKVEQMTSQGSSLASASERG
jgi:hypothetical protein